MYSNERQLGWAGPRYLVESYGERKIPTSGEFRNHKGWVLWDFSDVHFQMFPKFGIFFAH